MPRGTALPSSPSHKNDAPKAASNTLITDEEEVTMKRVLWALALAGTLGVLPAPQPAPAYPTDCLECTSQFPSDGELSISLRVWCYLLSAVVCPWH